MDDTSLGLRGTAVPEAPAPGLVPVAETGPKTGPQPETGPVAEPGLSYLMYRSLAAPGLSQPDLDQILAGSRRRNRDRGLTGCLHYEGGLFFQWLEGSRAALSRLLDALQEDPRHLGLTVLDQGPLPQRVFRNWAMHFSDARIASMMDWLADRRASGTTMDDVPEIRAFLSTLRH